MENKKQIANDLFFASVEEFLKEGRSVEMTVKGYSMRPFLRSERDVVTLAPLAMDAPLRRGQVVLFRQQGRHILHRLCGVENGRLVMKGDGNYRIEEVVPRGDVVAYVSAVKLANGHRFAYRSLCWRVRTLWSRGVKLLRTVALDLKRKIIK